jgi:hypothetical protein
MSKGREIVSNEFRIAERGLPKPLPTISAASAATPFGARASLVNVEPWSLQLVYAQVGDCGLGFGLAGISTIANPLGSPLNSSVGTDEAETTPKHAKVGVATSLPVSRRLEVIKPIIQDSLQTTLSGATARDWPSRRESLAN